MWSRALVSYSIKYGKVHASVHIRKFISLSCSRIVNGMLKSFPFSTSVFKQNMVKNSTHYLFFTLTHTSERTELLSHTYIFDAWNVVTFSTYIFCIQICGFRANLYLNQWLEFISYACAKPWVCRVQHIYICGTIKNWFHCDIDGGWSVLNKLKVFVVHSIRKQID